MAEPGALTCAFRALKKELIDFRFDYPLEIVPNSASKQSLSYYLYGDRLSWQALRLDCEGIPQAWFRATGTVYFPAYVAWYGLVHLGHYLRTGVGEEMEIFLRQISWLEDHAVTRSDGAVVWPMNFDYSVGHTRLKAPWVSAHAQGLCISALVRGWRVTGNQHLLGLLEGSTKVFEQDHRCGGIRRELPEGVFYSEVPGEPKPGIFDGFLTALLGLHDLFVETGDPWVKMLFLDGIAGLKTTLPSWDYRGKWSWYGCREYICSPAYHCLNRLLLLVLADITEESAFRECAGRWNPDRFTTLDHLEIYFTYNLTLNISRLRHHSWRQTPSPKSQSDCMGPINSSYSMGQEDI